MQQPVSEVGGCVSPCVELAADGRISVSQISTIF